MGITCKQTGKFKGFLVRVDNQIEADKKAAMERRAARKAESKKK